MRTFLLFSLFCISLLTSLQVLAKEARDMSEPPFIMSSYDEFADLQQEQKEFYLKELAVQFQEVPALKANDTAKLNEASEWYSSWDLIRKSVYAYCDENEATKTCEKLADLRVKMLEDYAVKPFASNK